VKLAGLNLPDEPALIRWDCPVNRCESGGHTPCQFSATAATADPESCKRFEAKVSAHRESHAFQEYVETIVHWESRAKHAEEQLAEIRAIAGDPR
jgi:hypothetical protein